ncbi:MAG: trigger factor [Rhodobacteraceae bacterium]|nr:trigger factor [Paracoccaceae bacterium]
MPGLIDFAGRWVLERRIDDRLAGAVGRFEGVAELTPDGAGLAYVERGLLTLGTGAPMAAERRYVWAAGEAGRIAVAFADGRAFHSFDPGAGTAEATHWCDPDDYRVSYDFSGWPLWRAVWQVRGPRKDYRMESVYRR